MMTAVGQSVERLDIRTKVMGSRKYPQDFAMEGMLHAVVVWAEQPHARIVGIEVGEALALPGVVAVFTHRDVPVNEYGINEYDQPVLAADKVRWMGDRVAVGWWPRRCGRRWEGPQAGARCLRAAARRDGSGGRDGGGGTACA